MRSTIGDRPTSPSSGIRAGTRIRMLTVGAVSDAPVIGSIPGVFDDDDLGRLRDLGGRRLELVAEHRQVQREVLAGQRVGGRLVQSRRSPVRERIEVERLGGSQGGHVELRSGSRAQTLRASQRPARG